MNSRINKETVDYLQESDQKSFEQIFVAYYGKIKTFIRAIIKSETDAEDITQDIFVKLWINRHEIDPQKSINAYMYTAARNAAFNHLKHRTVSDKYLANHRLQEVEVTPEEWMYAREIELLMEMAVSQMPAQRQMIYRMSRNSGLENDDIAQQLGISKKTVENQLSLALKELRRIIAAFTLFFV